VNKERTGFHTGGGRGGDPSKTTLEGRTRRKIEEGIRHTRRGRAETKGRKGGVSETKIHGHDRKGCRWGIVEREKEI